MCGLVGAIRARDVNWTKKIEDFMFLGLHMSVLRGHSGSGVGTVDKDNSILVQKSQIDAVTWMCTPQYDQVNNSLMGSRIIMGHTRAPTFQNTVSARNAQPFHYDNTEKSRSVVMTHNGHLSNHWDLTKDIEKFTHPVDSAHICRSLAEYGALTTLEKSRGGFALAWYDDWTDKFYIASNGKRSLAMAFDPDGSKAYYASESGMLQFALDRAGIEYQAIMEVPAMKILSWGLDGKKLEELAAVDFQNPPAYPTYTGGIQHGGKHMGSTTGSTTERPKILWVYIAKDAELIPYGRGNEKVKKKGKKFFGHIIGNNPSHFGTEIRVQGLNSEDWARWDTLRISGLPCKINSITKETINGKDTTIYFCTAIKDEVEKELIRVLDNRRSVLGPHVGGSFTPLLTAASSRKVEGPEGTQITFLEWRELADENCADCGCTILNVDNGKVSFDTVHERVEDNVLQKAHLIVCPICTRDRKDREAVQSRLAGGSLQ